MTPKASLELVKAGTYVFKKCHISSTFLNNKGNVSVNLGFGVYYHRLV